jgi:tetratricopeptide (TPR) repeat protein
MSGGSAVSLALHVGTFHVAENYPKACFQCSRIVETSQRCGPCRHAVYCDKKCQVLHWRAGHKEVCGRVPHIEALLTTCLKTKKKDMIPKLQDLVEEAIGAVSVECAVPGEVMRHLREVRKKDPYFLCIYSLVLPLWSAEKDDSVEEVRELIQEFQAAAVVGTLEATMVCGAYARIVFPVPDKGGATAEDMWRFVIKTQDILKGKVVYRSMLVAIVGVWQQYMENKTSERCDRVVEMARHMIAAVEKRGPDDGREAPSLIAALTLFDQHRYGEALAMDELALHCQQTRHPAIDIMRRGGPVRRAVSLCVLQRWSDAEVVCRTLLADDGGHDLGELWMILGECLLAQGRYDEAIENFDKAKEVARDADMLVKAISYKAGALDDMGRIDESINEDRLVISLNLKRSRGDPESEDDVINCMGIGPAYRKAKRCMKEGDIILAERLLRGAFTKMQTQKNSHVYERMYREDTIQLLLADILKSKQDDDSLMEAFAIEDHVNKVRQRELKAVIKAIRDASRATRREEQVPDDGDDTRAVESECGVCFTEYDDHEFETLADCAHTFCALCLASWRTKCAEMQWEPTCPMCRSQM